MRSALYVRGALGFRLEMARSTQNGSVLVSLVAEYS